MRFGMWSHSRLPLIRRTLQWLILISTALLATWSISSAWAAPGRGGRTAPPHSSSQKPSYPSKPGTQDLPPKATKQQPHHSPLKPKGPFSKGSLGNWSDVYKTPKPPEGIPKKNLGDFFESQFEPITDYLWIRHYGDGLSAANAFETVFQRPILSTKDVDIVVLSGDHNTIEQARQQLGARATINPSRQDLFTAIQKKKKGVLVIVGHIEGRSVVLRNLHGETIWEIDILELEVQAKLGHTNLLILGCNSAATATFGTLGTLNSIVAVERLSNIVLGDRQTSISQFLKDLSSPYMQIVVDSSTIFLPALEPEIRGTLYRRLSPSSVIASGLLFMYLCVLDEDEQDDEMMPHKPKKRGEPRGQDEHVAENSVPVTEDSDATDAQPEIHPREDRDGWESGAYFAYIYYTFLALLFVGAGVKAVIEAVGGKE